MICNSYDQLTIIEKTQFIGKLIHLIQSNEDAFKEADSLLNKASQQGWLNNVTILPKVERANPLVVAEWKEEAVPNSFEVINREDFLHSSSGSVSHMLQKTRDSIHRSYQKIFTRLAS